MEANILSYGAVADGVTLNSEAIQKTIDAVADAGGGRVTVPAGTFLTGTIWLKSHVELHLENGAVLKASENLDDYNAEDAYRQNWGCISEFWIGKHLIVAVEQTDVSVTGKGVIDASGDVFFDESTLDPLNTGYAWRYGIVFSKKGTYRPGQTMCIVECCDVLIRDVSFVNSPCWSCFIHGCENVVINGIRVKNRPYHANTDGIDIDASKNVTVSDCIIDTGDDAIAIRCAGKRIREDLELCENITITNCVCTSRSCGVRVCVGMGTIRNVTMSNIIFKESSPAILLASSYMKNGKVNIENMMINNVIADDVGRPITILESNDCTVRNVSVNGFTGRVMCQCKFVAEDIGNIKDIHLRDVNLELVKPSFAHGDNEHRERGLYAFELSGVENFRFDNVNIKISDDVDIETYRETSSCGVEKIDCNF